MRLYSPVDLTGNVNMIEKLVLGGTGTGDSRSSARRANLCAIKSRWLRTAVLDCYTFKCYISSFCELHLKVLYFLGNAYGIPATLISGGGIQMNHALGAKFLKFGMLHGRRNRHEGFKNHSKQVFLANILFKIQNSHL